MKSKKITLSLAVILLAGAVAFTSCKKKSTTSPQAPDSEQGTAADNNYAENTSNDIVSMGSQVSENGGTLSTYRTSEENDLLSGSCATISPVMSGTNVTGWTVDFGPATSTCVCQDGKVRSGKLIFDFSGSPAGAKHYRNPGFKMNVSSVNYVVEGNAVSVTKTIENTTSASIPTGTNPGTNLTWSITANLSITKANNGGTITWNCNRTKTLVNTSDPTVYHGQSTAITWSLAKIQLDGTANGTNNKGDQYSAVVTALVRDFTCHPDGLHPKRSPFVSGTIDYTPANKPTRHIDFGNGTCDLSATLTLNGTTYTITLP